MVCTRLLLGALFACTALGGDEDSVDLSFIQTAPDEATASQDFDAYVSSGGVVSRDAGKDAVEHAMEHSWWDLATKVVRIAEEAFDVDLSSVVHQTGGRIRSRLQALSDALHKTAPGAAGIPPAFEWAQSPDTVLLNLKFAHKIDTPATLGCEVTPADVELSALSLRLRANCREKRKAFDLQLSLHEAIDPAASSWSLTSVGRALVTLKKAVNGTWPRLLKGGKKPAHMHVWWAMREKYEAENEAFDKKVRETAKAAATAAAAAGAASNSSAPPPSASPAPATDGAAAEARAGDEPGDSAPLASTDAPPPGVAASEPAPAAAAAPAAAVGGEGSAASARARRALERELRAVDAAERTELQAIEQEARAAKMAVDAAARTDKARAEAAAQAKREALAAEKAAERDAIRRRHAGGGGGGGDAGDDAPLLLAGGESGAEPGAPPAAVPAKEADSGEL